MTVAPRAVSHAVLVVLTSAVFLADITPIEIAAVSTPMIVMTMTSSTRVKPREAARRRLALTISLGRISFSLQRSFGSSLTAHDPALPAHRRDHRSTHRTRCDRSAPDMSAAAAAPKHREADGASSRSPRGPRVTPDSYGHDRHAR